MQESLFETVFKLLNLFIEKTDNENMFSSSLLLSLLTSLDGHKREVLNPDC